MALRPCQYRHHSIPSSPAHCLGPTAPTLPETPGTPRPHPLPFRIPAGLTIHPHPHPAMLSSPARESRYNADPLASGLRWASGPAFPLGADCSISFSLFQVGSPLGLPTFPFVLPCRPLRAWLSPTTLSVPYPWGWLGHCPSAQAIATGRPVFLHILGISYTAPQ